MLAFWKTYYRSSNNLFEDLLEPQRVYEDGQSEVSKFRQQNNPQDEECDEYEMYCLTPRLSQKSRQRPIDWWRDAAQQEAYPILSR
jgi:hypothetical protein